MTGLELRLKRVALRLTAVEVAKVMQVTSSRVSNIETRDRVTADAERKYLEALATLTTVPTDPSAQEEAAS